MHFKHVENRVGMNALKTNDLNHHGDWVEENPVLIQAEHIFVACLFDWGFAVTGLIHSLKG